MPKDLITTLATEGLKNPNYSKSGADDQQIDDKNFTEATNDISAPARLTLGAFLSQKTAKNLYPISSKSTLLDVKSRGVEAGLLVPAERNDQKVFADQNDLSPLQATGLGIKSATIKGATNRQVTFFDDNDLNSFLSKNASNPSLSGDTLLSDVPKDTVSPLDRITAISVPAGGEGRGVALLKTTHAKLVEGNMYTSDADQSQKQPFSSNPGGQNEEEKTRGLFTVQKDLGTFSATAERITTSQMKTFAESRLTSIMQYVDTVNEEETISSTFSALLEMGLLPIQVMVKLLPAGVRLFLDGAPDPGEEIDPDSGNQSLVTKESQEFLAGLQEAQDSLNEIVSLSEASYAQIMTYLNPVLKTIKTKAFAENIKFGLTQLVFNLLEYVDPPQQNEPPSYLSKVLPDDFTKSLNFYDYTQNDGKSTTLKEGGKLGSFRRQTYRWGENNTNALSISTFFAAQKPLPILHTTPGNRDLTPSRENVELIENSLESEYMPFYIHDLRTHELMSMPAFITEFGDTFTPSYNSVDGIGRQDPVRIYQKTERAVTLGFMLVSFNRNDMNHMWMAINKLVAMCYPQYSKGRIRETEKDKDGNFVRFIQPFSQVPAASPLVRIRLADVFKSNYSKFGLMRLFGVPDHFERKTDQTNELKNAIAKRNTVISEVQDAYSKDFTKRKDEGKLNVDERVTLLQNDKPYNSKGKRIKGSISEGTIAKVKESRVFEFEKNQIAGYTVVTETNQELVVPSRLISPQMPNDDLTKKVNSDTKVNEANEKVKKENNGKEPDSTINSDFFTSEKNAIVRSFETTRGRGVAGFITSLALDYGMGSHPWSSSVFMKAPMVVKISLGFAPITDLPLGLDYDGVIRNPSHPVGDIAGSFGDPYYSQLSESDISSTPTTNIIGKVRTFRNTGFLDARSEIEKSFEQKGITDLADALSRNR